MRYRIFHWYGQTPPVPEAIQVVETDKPGKVIYEVEVDDLNEFALKHGNIMLIPPGSSPAKEHWAIYVTHNGKFTQVG